MVANGLGKAQDVRVRIFGGDTIGQIESRVDEWFQQNPEATLLDIKFAFSLSYRVMIIYRQEKEPASFGQHGSPPAT